VSEAKPTTSSVRLAGTLAVAGILSGTILVAAYEVTTPMIEAHRRAAIRKAVFEVVPGADRMRKLAFEGGALKAVDEGAPGPAVYAAWGQDGFKGWAVAAEGAGFQDTIRLLWGVAPDGQRSLGIAVLESRETPGLGDRIYKDPRFGAAFQGLALHPVVELVKPGEGGGPNQVDGITGATISSKAVVKIVNTGNAEWLSRLPATPPVEAPAAPAGGEAP
jgi:electron transport complex protein RnfG